MHGTANFPSTSSFGLRPCNHTRVSDDAVLSDGVPGTWAGLSAGQLPPATKHWVSSFHSTAHCTPGHQNLFAPTKSFSWPACQVSDLDVGCVALARPWVSTFQIFVPGCALQHHPLLPLPSPLHRRAAWFVSLGHCASFGGGGCAGRACASWCKLSVKHAKPRCFAPWLGLRQ